MKKSSPSTSDKQFSMDESAENSSNDYMNLSKEFQMNMINENKKIKKAPVSDQNQNNKSDIQNESSSDHFWDQEFDPALDSFLKSISKDSNMEIDALNEVIQELKKLKNTSNKSNTNNQIPGDNLNKSDEAFDSSAFIDKFNSCFHVSTSSVDEVLDMIELIKAKRRNSKDSKYFNNISPIQNSNHINKAQYDKNSYENQYFSPKETKYQTFSQNQQKTNLKNRPNDMDFSSPLEIDDEQNHKYDFQDSSINDESNSQRNISSSQSPIFNQNKDLYQNQKQTPLQNLYQNYHLPEKSKREEYGSFNDNSYYNNHNDDSNYTSSSKNLISSNSNSSDIDFLRERLNKLESENRKYKDQIRHQEEKINFLVKNNEKLSQSKKRMHQAFDGIENLLKEQIKSTEELMTQRDSLVSLVQKQNVAFQEMEKRYDDLQQQIIIERLSSGQNKNNNEKASTSNQNANQNLNAYLHEMQSDSDRLLAELLNVSKQFSENLPEEISNEIIQIRDNTNIPIQSRINNILNCVCKHLQMTLQENESVKKEVMKISDEISTSESSKSKVINFLENELLFLQKITESSELQSVVFYKPDLGHSLQLDPESRNALLQRCLNAHQFIDKNIGFYSFEQNEKLTQPFNNVIDPSSIFALNQTEEFENKMKSLLSLIDEKCQNINDNDYSLFYDVLFSQSIMNEILQKHVSYLQSQLQFSHRQNQISDQQLSDLSVIKKNYKDAQNLLATMQEKEKKICEFILNYFPDLSTVSEQKRKSASSSESEINTSNVQEKAKEQEEIIDNLYLVIKALIDRYQKQGDDMNEQNKNVEIKLKEAKKIFCARLEKSNKRIKQLKHHLSILKDEILRREAISKQSNSNQAVNNDNNNNNNIQAINAQLFGLRNREIENLQLIQMKLSELKRLKIILRKSIINLHDQFRSQIDQFRENAQSALGISLNYKKLAEKNQKTIAQFVKEREALKLKIKQGNQGFALSVTKFEAMIRQLKSHISSLEDEIKQIKSENATLNNTNRAIQCSNNNLRSKIESLNVSNKSLEIKINSAFNNFNNEKRELNIQFEARMNSLQSDMDSKIKEEQSKNLEMIRCLYKMANKYLNTEVFQTKNKDRDDFISPETVINSLSALIDDLKNKQEQYFSVLNDLQKVQKILMLDQNSLVSSKVEQVVSELVDTKRILSDIQCELSQAKKKILFLSNDNNSMGKMTSQIKQWERWARRVCSIASSAACTTFSTSQLQNSLEEFILSSLEQRPLMCRVQTLRDEKKYFLKFPKSILTESISYAQLNSKARIPSFRAVIIVYLGVRRIQKAAGLLPLGYDQNSIKKVLDNEEKKH